MPLLGAAEAAAALGAALRLQLDGTTVRNCRTLKRRPRRARNTRRSDGTRHRRDHRITWHRRGLPHTGSRLRLPPRPQRLGPRRPEHPDRRKAIRAHSLRRCCRGPGAIARRRPEAPWTAQRLVSRCGNWYRCACGRDLRLWPSVRMVGIDPWQPALALARDHVAAPAFRTASSCVTQAPRNSRTSNSLTSLGFPPFSSRAPRWNSRSRGYMPRCARKDGRRSAYTPDPAIHSWTHWPICVPYAKAARSVTLKSSPHRWNALDSQRRNPPSAEWNLPIVFVAGQRRHRALATRPARPVGLDTPPVRGPNPSSPATETGERRLESPVVPLAPSRMRAHDPAPRRARSGRRPGWPSRGAAAFPSAARRKCPIPGAAAASDVVRYASADGLRDTPGFAVRRPVLALRSSDRPTRPFPNRWGPCAARRVTFREADLVGVRCARYNAATRTYRIVADWVLKSWLLPGPPPAAAHRMA